MKKNKIDTYQSSIGLGLALDYVRFPGRDRDVLENKQIDASRW